MAINPQTGLQQFGFFKKIAKKLLKPPGGSKFIKKTLMPPGLKKSLEYSLLPHRALGMSERDLLLPHRALGMSERDLLMPHRALRREKDRGIGGLPRKLLEGRQFPTGIPEQFRQLPFGPPTMQPMVPFLQERATVVPRDLQQPAPVEQFGGTVVPRGPEDMMMYPGGTPGFYDHGTFDLDLPRAPSPEEITQQRIDQVSQFEQEPMMGARYGDIGGYAGGGIAELLHYYGR